MKGNSVTYFYKTHHEDLWLSKEKCKDVDANSFEELEDGNKYGSRYGKDKDRVYFMGKLLEGADPSSFKIMKDIRSLAKDKKNVYFGDQLVSEDARNFKIVAKKHAVDSKQVYLFAGKFIHTVEGADPNTFQAFSISHDMFTDKNHLYRGTKKIEGVQPSEIMILSNAFWKTRTQVFKQYTPIENVDAESFKVLDRHYSKDKKNVYYDSKVLPNCDPASVKFLLIGGEKYDYIRDREQVFFRGKVIKGADPITFKMLAAPEDRKEFSNFCADRKRVYHMSSVIEGADPKTFKIVPEKNRLGNQLATDGKKVFFCKSVIPGADPNSVESLYYSNEKASTYWKDKSRVYYEENVVEGADAKTFKVTNKETGEDANGRFYLGKNSGFSGL